MLKQKMLSMSQKLCFDSQFSASAQALIESSQKNFKAFFSFAAFQYRIGKNNKTNVPKYLSDLYQF